MRARVLFDTLAYVNRLKAAGVDPKIAEAQSEANVEMLNTFFYDGFANKEDVHSLRQDIAAVRKELKQDIAEVRQELAEVRNELKQDIAEVRQELAEVRNELKQDIAGVRQELAEFKLEVKQEFQSIRLELKHDLKDLEHRMTIRLGIMIFTAITICTTISSFLH